MRLNNIVIREYMSFEHVEYCFTTDCVLIQGRNSTDASQETNGTGKTSFQSAIEYALTGNTSQKLKDTDLIRHGKDAAEIVLDIFCSVRQETLKIARYIKRGKSSRVAVFVNDINVKVATVNDSNNYILNWLSISKDDLQNYFIVNKERYKNFFQNSHTEKIKIIGRFTNGNLIDGTDVFINKDIEAIHEVKGQFFKRLDTLTGQVSGYQESLNYELERDLKKEKERAIESLQAKKKSLLKTIEETGELIVDNMILATHANQEKSRLTDLVELEVLKVSEINIKDLKSKIDTLDKVISESTKERSDLSSEMQVGETELRKMRQEMAIVEKKLMGVVKCPSCNHAFYPYDNTVDIVCEDQTKIKLKEQIADITLSIGNISDKYDSLNESISKLYLSQESQQSNLSNLQKQINERQNKIARFNNSIEKCVNERKLIKLSNDKYTKEIEDDQQRVKDIEHQIENFHDILIDAPRIKDLREWIRLAEEEKEELQKNIDQLTDSIFSLGQWLYNFKQFKNFLANRFLEVIGRSCNGYLEQINSDIRIRLDGFKQKVDGSLSEKITAIVTRDNIEREFNSYSGGERARLELCIILTIRDLINQAHPYNGLDFLFTDEIFEGLDGKGLTQLTKAAQALGNSIMMTTHVNDNRIHDHILTIEKVNGISKLYEC